MPTELTTNGTEEGTYIITASFTDEDDNAVVPNSINWSLYDSTGNIVNGRNNVPVPVPASTITIVLQGDDLAIIGTDGRRVLRIDYDYDSAAGSGLPGKKEVEFDVTNLETYKGSSESTLTLTVGTNTWVTLAEANSYMAAKWGAESWSEMSAENRKKLLIHAYNWINRLSNYSFGSTITTNMKYAQIELSWYVYENNDGHKKHEALNAQGVKEFDISKFSEKLTGKTELPQTVKDLLADYDLYSGGYLPLVDREVEEND